jgi:hypothetical protein
MFNLFRKKPTPPQQPTMKGLFGYYGLYDWWMNEFDNNEKERLKIAYGTAGMGIPFERYYSGSENPLMHLNRGKGAVDILSGILGNVLHYKNYPTDIVEKIIVKANSLIDEKSDVVDCHFAYMHEINFYKAHIKNSPRHEQRFVQSCLKQIAIADKVKERFKTEGMERLPHHSGFWDLQDYYEKNGKWQEAYDLSNEAVRVWGGVVESVDYESWLDALIAKNDVNEAQRVLELMKEEFDDDELCAEYEERIENLN